MCAGLLGLLCSCVTVDEGVFFFPVKMRGNPERYFEGTGLSAERAFVPTSDGEKLETIFIHAAGARATILFFMGKGGNTSWYYPLFKEMAMAGRLNVLGVNFRGYGESTGRPSLAGITTDMEAAVGHLHSLEPAAGLPAWVCGFSTGCYYALYCASMHPELSGCILLAPFTSARAEIEKVRRSLMWLTFWLTVTISPTVDQMDNLALAREYVRPLLIVHGDRDQVIPPHMAQEIFDASASPRKKIVYIEGSRHDALTIKQKFYTQAVKQISIFLDELAGAQE